MSKTVDAAPAKQAGFVTQDNYDAACEFARNLALAPSWPAKLNVIDNAFASGAFQSELLAQPAEPPRFTDFGLISERPPYVPFYTEALEFYQKHTVFTWITIWILCAMACYLIFGRSTIAAIAAVPSGGFLAGLSSSFLKAMFYFSMNKAEAMKVYLSYKRAVDHHSRVERIRDTISQAYSAQIWLKADGRTFEHLVARFFRQQGWHVEVLGGANDGGVDLLMRREARRAIVQCKAHSKPVGPAVARELYGALGHSQATEGYLATLNGVTPRAAEWLQD